MEKVPSKNKIIIAWLLLILLLSCLLGLIYIKHTYKEDETKEVIPSQVQNEEIITELNEIVNNFNNNSLLNNYETEDFLRLRASLDNNIITINYEKITQENIETTEDENLEGNAAVIYTYDVDKNILSSIKGENISDDIYNKIFRILVLSVQERLQVNINTNSDTETDDANTRDSSNIENEVDVNLLIDKFLNDEDVDGLIRSDFGYSINITVKFKNIEEEDSEKEENSNTGADIVDAVRSAIPNNSESGSNNPDSSIDENNQTSIVQQEQSSIVIEETSTTQNSE